MLKQYRRRFNSACFFADLIALPFSFLIAYELRGSILPLFIPYLNERSLYPLSRYLPILLLALLCTVAAMFVVEGYRREPVLPLSITFLDNLKAALLAFLLSLALAYGLKMQWLSRIFLGALILMQLLLSTSAHYALSLWFRSRAQKGLNKRVIVLIGSGQQAREVAQRLIDHTELGITIRGFFEDEKSFDPVELEEMQRLGITYLGDISQVVPFAKREVVDGVVFAVDTKHLGRTEDLFIQLEDLGLDALVAANIFPHLMAKARLEHIEDLPLLRFSTVPQEYLPLFIKRAVDLLGSAIGLIILSPLLAVAALAIKLNDRGPVLFCQERVGLNGRRFTLYKFRTMVADAEKMKDQLEQFNEADGPVFKIKNDPRITPIGRFLRKTSMDELPQLWNVLKGEMSIVGPRPPIPCEVDKYERWQRRRLSMRPGITCLWQISGRSDLDFNTWMKLDLQYIDQWSLTLDAIILLKTIPAVLSTRGAA